MNPDLPALERQVRALVTQDRLEEAEALLRPLVASGSGPLPVWRLLVQVLRLLGRSAEALPIQRMLVDTVPGDLAARFDLSEILLLRGDFDPGWRAYRYRYSLPHTARIERKVQRPRWEGEPIPGRTLLIHDEQGYGDTFQFLRLVPWAKQRSGARVVLEINPETLPLAQRSPLGIDTLIPNGALPPAFDVHCELMSLPMALRLQLSDLPGPLPYLAPDPARLAHWRQRLAGLQRPIVALAWAGRPNHHNDANRSTPLAALTPLAMPGVSFVAIQKGPAAAGSGANRLRDRAGRFVRPALFAISCRQHGIPDRRRTSALETQPAEIELSLVDPAQQFNAGNRDRCGLKPLKSQHWTDA